MPGGRLAREENVAGLSLSFLSSPSVLFRQNRGGIQLKLCCFSKHGILPSACTCDGEYVWSCIVFRTKIAAEETASPLLSAAWYRGYKALQWYGESC